LALWCFSRCLHRKHPSGLNIWTCEVTGPRKTRHLHGYLLQNPVLLWQDTPSDNPHISISRTSTPPAV